MECSRYGLHHLPDFWKQSARLRLSKAIHPSGRLYLQDVAFSFDAEVYDFASEAWVHRMPGESGFSRSEFETHLREEFSTYSWVLEGFLEQVGFEILEKTYSS